MQVEVFCNNSYEYRYRHRRPNLCNLHAGTAHDACDTSRESQRLQAPEELRPGEPWSHTEPLALEVGHCQSSHLTSESNGLAT